MKLLPSVAALGALLVLATTAQSPLPSPSALPKPARSAPIQIKLLAQNDSGESGTATLLDGAKGLIVKLRLEGGGDAVQPAHIHKGACDRLDPKPAYPLTTVRGGASETTIPGLTLAALGTSPYAINVHKSTTDIPTYVTCGNLAKAK